MDYKELGKRIKQQRILAGMTQEKLAEAASISLSFLGHIERGTRKSSLETLVAISNALKISPHLLLQDSLDSDLLGNPMMFTESQKRMLREITGVVAQYGTEKPEDTK